MRRSTWAAWVTAVGRRGSCRFRNVTETSRLTGAPLDSHGFVLLVRSGSARALPRPCRKWEAWEEGWEGHTAHCHLARFPSPDIPGMLLVRGGDSPGRSRTGVRGGLSESGRKHHRGHRHGRPRASHEIKKSDAPTCWFITRIASGLK